jgi:hypothetical protein
MGTGVDQHPGMSRVAGFLFLMLTTGCMAPPSLPPEVETGAGADGGPAAATDAGADAGPAAATDAGTDAGPTAATDAGSCDPGSEPLCCVGSCGNDVVAQPVCSGGAWACPAGSVDCPQNQCTLPRDPSATQHAYTYPGCDAGTAYCPNDLTVYCALEKVRQDHAACAVDADCVRAKVMPRCTGWGECPPPFVSAALAADFSAAAQAEIDRYCPSYGGCWQSGQCATNPDDYLPKCAAGSCTGELPADGGM